MDFRRFFKQEESVNNDEIWKNSEGRIKILNPKDFQIPDFVTSIINDFRFNKNLLGLTNPDEIKSRLEIMRILMKQEMRIRFDNYLEFFKHKNDLPSSENEFLLEYKDGSSSFWNHTTKFAEFISKFQNIDSLKSLYNKITENAHLQKEEEDLSVLISERLSNVSFIEGIIKMRFPKGPGRESEILEHIVLGKKEFNASYSDDYIANVPKWARNGFAKFLGIKDVVQNIKNNVATKRANKSSLITNLPMCIVEDIENEFATGAFYNVLEDYGYCTFTIHFAYDRNGLKVEFVAVEKPIYSRDFNFTLQRFGGLTKFERRKFKRVSGQISELYSKTYAMQGLKDIYNELETKLNLFSSKYKISSGNTDREYKWYALKNLYEENAELVSKLIFIRRYIKDNLYEINKAAKIVKYMSDIAMKKGLDICIPEILDQGSGTEFEELAPLEIFHKDNIVPFTLPKINGHILCLTGRHGGGKSVAGKSILSSVFLAQSGLPVFAKSFKTEIKTVIGSIVNDEGEGSTATVFVNKIKSLLEGIGTVPKGESIIFIDEIGKGTQEAAGINLGKRLLKTLKEKEYSVVFNSQILQLAEYAQEELGTICYVVDKNHKFKPGIGDGQMDELIKEKGLDKLLV